MNTLKQKLEEFAEWPHNTEDELTNAFEKLAPYFLYGGCFLIEGKKLYLDDIEFYYHDEDEGGIKDPIMYHTNEHERKELPYFELGRLNLHVSGVDVTFENPQKHYRASFLIRGFHMEGKPYDPHSTHIYDEMLYMGVPLGKAIEIEWIEEDVPDKNNYKPIGISRLNVAEYNKYENGKYVKIEYKDGKYSKEEYLKKDFDSKQYFRYSGKIFKQCQRKWRFKKERIVYEDHIQII